MSLNNLGFAAWRMGDYSAAREYYEQSLIIHHELGTRGETVLINLGHLNSSQGNVAAGKRYYEQALAIQHEIGDLWGEGISLNELGAVALAQDDLPRAERYYHQALTIRRNLDQPQYLVEDWAGIAKVKLEQGEGKSASGYIQQIVEYLRENPSLDGAENPMRVFRFTWEALKALGHDEEANQVLSLAINIIQDYLDKNNDPVSRGMYLGQPHHAVLWSAWKRKHPA